jgi:hypothetical protein
MTHQTIKAHALPKHCIRAPKGFVPHRIKLQRERKAQEAQEKAVMDDCAAWQEHIEEIEALLENE